MKYRLLGNSGLRVAEMSLGTMTFGEDWGWGSSKDEARKVYETYREAGGNFIDTANVYTNGTSETLVGEFIHDHRQEVVLATKYTNAGPSNDSNASGNHRKSMVQALDRRRSDASILPPGFVHRSGDRAPHDEVWIPRSDQVKQYEGHQFRDSVLRELSRGRFAPGSRSRGVAEIASPLPRFVFAESCLRNAALRRDFRQQLR
jgi:aryl-alcohol dehydrogenase-like predicted oxidoreductase